MPDDLMANLAGKFRVDTGTGCWLWIRSRHTHGYGKLRIGGKDYYAHRVAYEARYGPIPEGMEIDHLCCVKACCNPHHLEAVTHAENVRRIVRTPKKACRAGHLLTPDNTYSRGVGRVRCKACFTAKRYAGRYLPTTARATIAAAQSVHWRFR